MPSPVARQAILLSGTAVKPVWQANFLSPVLVASQILPSGLTYTKSGSIPATLFDSTGKLTYQANNILVYTSNDISMSQWQVFQTTKGTEATANPFSASSVAYINSNNGVTSGGSVYQTQNFNPVNFITTFVVKARGAQRWVYIGTQDGGTKSFQWFDLVNGVAGSAIGNAASPTITSLGNGFYRVSTKTSFTGGAAYVVVALGVATADGSQNSDGVTTNGAYFYTASCAAVTYETTPRSIDQQITTSAAYYAPRLDTNPSTLAPAGLLVEEQRVNIALYSRTYTNAAWTNANNHLTLASGQGTSIDGTNSLWKVTQTGNGDDNLYQAVTTGAGSYTTSYIVKAGNTSWMWLDVNQTTDHIVWYNLTGNGSIGTQSGATGTIQYLGNSLYRITHTFTAVVNNAYLGAPMPCTADNVLTRVNGSYIFVDYSQLEAGAFATSITAPTQASTVTRTADVVSGANYNATQGSIIAEFAAYSPATAAQKVFSLSPVAQGKYLAAGTDGSAGWYNTGLQLSTGSANTPIRIGITYNSTGLFTAASNGASAYLASSASDYTGGATRFGLGDQTASGQFLNGWLRSIATYNVPMAKAPLQSRVVIGAPY